MVKIENILVPTDFSVHSELAYQWALSLAKEFGAKVKLMNVFDISELMGLGWSIYGGSLEGEIINRMEADAKKTLGEFIDKFGAGGVEVSTLSARGKPFVEIVRAAKAGKFDMVVMGTHGRKGIEHLLIGSNAEKVVRKAPCSVLTVRHFEGEKAPNPKESLPIKRILAATDFSEPSELAMKLAVELARKHEARLIALNIYSDFRMSDAVNWATYVTPQITEAELDDKVLERTEEEFGKFMSKFDLEGITTSRLMISDTAHGGIVNTAKEENADIIIMGTHGRTGLSHLLLGSVAEKVVRKAYCPVLTVKSTDFKFEMP